MTNLYSVGKPLRGGSLGSPAAAALIPGRISACFSACKPGSLSSLKCTFKNGESCRMNGNFPPFLFCVNLPTPRMPSLISQQTEKPACRNLQHAGQFHESPGKPAHTARAYISSMLITCALSRFVDPVRPRGTPAVITTVSPFCTSPSFSPTSAQREKMRSVELTSPAR